MGMHMGVADDSISNTRNYNHLFDSCLGVAGILAGNDRSWDGLLRQPVETILRLVERLFTVRGQSYLSRLPKY
jgi:hypothetical protein